MVVVSRREVLAAAGLACLSGAGCGTIMYPERRGQPAGDIDWKVVALDGLGLLLFFVPGVVAFAVDFSSGAIYLPPVPPMFEPEIIESAGDRPTLRRIDGNGPPTQEQIERVVSKHVGRPVRLADHAYAASRLNRIEDFWPRVEALASAQPSETDRALSHARRPRRILGQSP